MECLPYRRHSEIAANLIPQRGVTRPRKHYASTFSTRSESSEQFLASFCSGVSSFQRRGQSGLNYRPLRNFFYGSANQR